MRTNKFMVHRDVVGSLKHVAYESGDITLCDDLVTDQWVFDRDEGNLDRCLKTLLRVNGWQLSYDPGGVVRKVYEKLIPPAVKTIPWSLCMPTTEYVETLKNFLTSVSMLDVDTNYYDNVFVPYRRLLSKMKPFNVDIELMRNIFDDATDLLAIHLESFMPSEDGRVRTPTYNFFGTRTGRLTVSSGPMVLTLPKEHRRIVVPERGKRIVQIDFSSLEPRFLAGLAGLKTTGGDFYEEVSRICFTGSLPRNKTKVAILGILYGMSVDTLSKNIELPVDDCRTILSSVKKHFKVKEAMVRIERTTVGDTSKNYYGRTIEINQSSLLNNYVQSSGMDVVHVGFDKLVRDIEFMSVPFKPMFLIHDALVGEVAEEGYEALEKIVQKGYDCPKLGCNFPFTMEDFAK